MSMPDSIEVVLANSSEDIPCTTLRSLCQIYPQECQRLHLNVRCVLEDQISNGQTKFESADQISAAMAVWRVRDPGVLRSVIRHAVTDVQAHLERLAPFDGPPGFAENRVTRFNSLMADAVQVAAISETSATEARNRLVALWAGAMLDDQTQGLTTALLLGRDLLADSEGPQALQPQREQRVRQAFAYYIGACTSEPARTFGLRVDRVIDRFCSAVSYWLDHWPFLGSQAEAVKDEWADAMTAYQRTLALRYLEAGVP